MNMGGTEEETKRTRWPSCVGLCLGVEFLENNPPNIAFCRCRAHAEDRPVTRLGRAPRNILGETPSAVMEMDKRAVVFVEIAVDVMGLMIGDWWWR